MQRYVALCIAVKGLEILFVKNIHMCSLLRIHCVKGKKEHKFWIHPVIANCDDQGDYQHLIQELRSYPALSYAPILLCSITPILSRGNSIKGHKI